MKNKFCQGVISIFLCVILTPILTIACMLVEMSRYQGLIASLNEIVDCSSLSTLANYDSYIEDRFGLFAISQDCDIGAEFDSYYSTNVGMLGNQVTMSGSATATGKFPLSNEAVLKQQVLDFAESTDLTAFLLSDLNLEDLIEQLNQLEGLGALADTAGQIATLTTDIKTLVEKAEDLKNTVDSIISTIGDIQGLANTFIGKVEDFYNELQDDSFVFDDELESSYLDLIKKYEGEIEKVYGSASSLYDSIDDLYDKLKSIPDKVTDLQEAFDKAMASLEAVGESRETLQSSANGQDVGKTVDESEDIFTTVLNELEDAVDEATEELKSSVIQGVKDAAEDVQNELVAYFNISRYVDFDSYFSLPLSETAKADLEEIMGLIWNGSSLETVLQRLRDKFVPNLGSFQEISNVFERAISEAKESLLNNLADKLAEVLTNLVTAIQNLFDLDVFYDGNLNAYLSDATVATLSGHGDNPYETFLSALESMFDAVDTFVNGVKGGDFFKALSATKDLFNAVKKTIVAITQLVEQILSKIKEVAGYLTGTKSSFYELLLVSAYMTHNLPNRTSAGVGEVDKNLIYNVGLTGETLTGFKYSDIPVSTSGSGAGFSGLTGLVDFVTDAFNGGSDTMFKGAELEYIIGGTKSEILNQAITFFDIYFLRLIMDIPAVMTDGNVASMAAAATIASWVVYILVLVAEPLVDTILLVNGGNSYLLKNGCYMCPAGIPKLIDALVEVGVNNETVKNSLNELTKDSGGGFISGGTMEMGYSTHVLLALIVTVTESDMITRLGNLIQLEANQHYGSFDLSNAYTAVDVSVKVKYNEFISIFTFSDDSVLQGTIHKTRSY